MPQACCRKPQHSRRRQAFHSGKQKSARMNALKRHLVPTSTAGKLQRIMKVIARPKHSVASPRRSARRARMLSHPVEGRLISPPRNPIRVPLHGVLSARGPSYDFAIVLEDRRHTSEAQSDPPWPLLTSEAEEGAAGRAKLRGFLAKRCETSALNWTEGIRHPVEHSVVTCRVRSMTGGFLLNRGGKRSSMLIPKAVVR